MTSEFLRFPEDFLRTTAHFFKHHDTNLGLTTVPNDFNDFSVVLRFNPGICRAGFEMGFKATRLSIRKMRILDMVFATISSTLDFDLYA